MYPMETACATSMVAVQQSSGVPQQASGHSEMLAATTTPAACKPETSSLAAASAFEPVTERSHFGSKTCSRRVATADQRAHDSFEVVVSAYSYGMMRRSGAPAVHGGVLGRAVAADAMFANNEK